MSPAKKSVGQRNNLFFIFASLFGAVLNFAIYPLFARILTPEQFADSAVVISIATQVGAVLVAFNVVSIFLVDKYGAEKSKPKIQAIQKILIRIFIAACLALVLLFPIAKQALNLESIYYILPLSILLLSSIPVTTWSGYFLGVSEIQRVGIFNISSPFFKLILAWILAIQFGAMGGLLGIAIGQILGLLCMRLMPGSIPPSIISAIKKLTPAEITSARSLSRIVLISVFSVGLLAILQVSDLLIAKSSFIDGVDSEYAGISSISKILYFGGFILVWIVLPKFKINSVRHNYQLLLKSLFLLSSLSVLFMMALYALDDHVTQILLGSSFNPNINTLVLATLFQALVLVSTFYVYYLLVVERLRSAILFSLFAISAVPATIIANPLTPNAMLRHLVGSLLIAIILFLLLNYVLLSRAGKVEEIN